MASSPSNTTGGARASSALGNFFLIPPNISENISIAFYCFLIPTTVLVGMFGNILTFVVMYRQKLQTTTTIILTWVAVADFLSLASNAIFDAIRAVKIFNPSVGKSISTLTIPIFEKYIWKLPSWISNLLIVLIAIERSFAVVHPLKVRTMFSKKKVIVCIVLIYIFVPVLLLPGLFEYRVVNDVTNGTATTRLVKSHFGEHKFFDTFAILQPICFKLLPFFAVMICNFKIVVHLFHFAKQREYLQRTPQENRLQQELRVTKTLFIVTSLFFICNIPGTILFVLMNLEAGYQGTTRIPNNGYVLGLMIALFFDVLNCALNFLIYIVTNTQYRKQYKNVLFCQDGRELLELQTYSVDSRSSSSVFRVEVDRTTCG